MERPTTPKPKPPKPVNLPSAVILYLSDEELEQIYNAFNGIKN